MEQDKNVWIWVFVAVAMLLLFGSFGMGGYGMMGFGMGFGFLFMLLFWGVVIWLVITLINAAQSIKREDDSLTILKKRYASGEISKKQFEETKKELNR
ncbi:MAG: SHOCT domain-containing protein [Nanoarchaeota archaeon]